MTRSQSTRVRRLACATLLGLALHGCATVAPYERERLARADMELGADGDMNAGAEHATAYREGSSGGFGSSGGGCGCN
jgi:predicted component of type VI protein secretion system